MDIIDRRPNPHGKNLENIGRFLAKHKAVVREAVLRSLRERSIRQITDATQHDVTLPKESTHEPSFHVDFTAGKRHFVLAGNKENNHYLTGFSVGDKVERPEKGQGFGSGGSLTGQGEDAFRFTLTADQFMDIVLGDLALPDFMKKALATQDVFMPVRQGLANDGSPSNLDFNRTARRALARRMVLNRPKLEELTEAESAAEAFAPDDISEEAEAARQKVIDLKDKRARTPWMDPVDQRYRRFSQKPQPNTRAVVFCLMDVSDSMREGMKDMAKRFFLLLQVFLKRKYKKVETVYIRHTQKADEVDENTFFHSLESGGTVVSSGLEKIMEIMKKRYPSDSWNIYIAQASDGDNSHNDEQKCIQALNAIMPKCQYYAYIEVGNPVFARPGETDLWNTLKTVQSTFPRLAMKKVKEITDIPHVFFELFKRRAAGATAAFAPPPLGTPSP